MNQPPWTITRRWIDRQDAQRRWDKAYQMLLGQADLRTGDGPDGVADAPAPEESRRADHSRLHSRFDAAPSPELIN
jgi:hypothetical protein